MSFFEKVFSETETVLDEAEDLSGDSLEVSEEIQSTTPPGSRAPENPFTNYIRSVVRYGPSAVEAPEVTHEAPEVPQEEPVQESEALAPEIEIEESDEPVTEATPVQVIEPSAPALPAPTRPPLPVQHGSGVFRASSVEQKADVQVERIVDGLFDRMKVVWGNEERRAPAPSPPPVIEQTQQQQKRYALVESRNEITKLIRTEVPRAVKGELVTVLRTEIMKAVGAEIARVVREEFETIGEMMSKHLERLHAIEARLAKIEGSVEKEVKLSFPEGMVKIDAPVTVPEREVKIAAPINVQPPSVQFDEGAITVHFNKTGGQKEVHFERDPHDNTIKHAKIVDAVVTKTAEHVSETNG
jgi:BMFP domain-containing protein YqiC